MGRSTTMSVGLCRPEGFWTPTGASVFIHPFRFVSKQGTRRTPSYRRQTRPGTKSNAVDAVTNIHGLEPPCWASFTWRVRYKRQVVTCFRWNFWPHDNAWSEKHCTPFILGLPGKRVHLFKEPFLQIVTSWSDVTFKCGCVLAGTFFGWFEGTLRIKTTPWHL